MHILFLFTGGTIGSTEYGGIIAPDKDKPYLLLSRYEQKYGMDFSYTASTPYTLLSENMTERTLALLSATVKRALSMECYDGIVITHGSDTLQYTGAALGYILGNCKTPVTLVAADLPPDHPRSNALDNLSAAITLIKKGARGVLIPYRNEGEGVTRVHRATRTLGGIAFSGALLGAGEPYGWVSDAGVWEKNPAFREKPDGLDAPEAPFAEPSSVLRIFPYVGMKYPTLKKGVSAVLFDTYHAGTLPTATASFRRFTARATKRGIPMYAVGVKEGAVYESAAVYTECGITPLPSLCPIAGYMKLWLYGEKPEHLLRPRGGDIFR